MRYFINKAKTRIENYFDEILARRLIKRLYTLPKERWIEFSHTFNCWTFPQYFYDLMPAWWVKKWNKRRFDRAFNIISPVRMVVEDTFGEKEWLRHINSIKGQMTNNEFEYWYELSRSGGDVNSYYNKMFKMQEIEWWHDEVFDKIINSIESCQIK